MKVTLFDTNSAPLIRESSDDVTNVFLNLVDKYIVVGFVKNGHQAVSQDGKGRSFRREMVPTVFHDCVPVTGEKYYITC